MTDTQKPLIIKDWQNAMADSEHLGHALILKADIESFPGAVKVKNRLLSMATLITSQTFTANAATDLCTAAGDVRTQAEIDASVNFNRAAVTFTTTGTLPAGLSLNTVYFLIWISNTTFKVATTQANANAGTAIDITDAGTGVHTVTAVPMGQINYFIQDPNTLYWFAHDSNGRVWNTEGAPNINSLYLLTGNTLTNSQGNGLSLFQTSDGAHTYLFVFRTATIDIIEVTAAANIDTPSWTTGWKSLNSGASTGNPHYALLGQDNITYFVDGRYVGSIQEVAGKVFLPSDSTTYTFNNQALTLPPNEVAQWLEELGVTLLTAGGTFNKVYPWDRVSNSYTLPILCPENKIYRLKNLGNLIYILAGNKGNIYTTQGTYAKFFKKIPFYVINNAYSRLDSTFLTWGGIAKGAGCLLVGVGTGATGYQGVYKIYPDGRMVIDQQSYSGNTLPTVIFANDDSYKIGYSGGADYSDTTAQYSNFDTVLHSELFRVSDKTKKAIYSQVEVQLAKAITSGSSHCRVSYRFDSTSNFTVLATFTLDVTATSFNTDIGITNIENIQIQIELDGNIELSEVRLFP